MGSRLVPALLGVAAVAGMGYGAVRSLVLERAERRWRELQAWVASARAEYERRDWRREVAHGTGHDDDAYAHYSRASVLARPLRRHPVGGRLFDALAGKPDATATSAVRAVWAPALAEMRLAAHSRMARPPLGSARWALGGEWIPLNDCGHAAVLEARLAIEGGDGQRAVEWLLDAVTMALDLLPLNDVPARHVLARLAQACSGEVLQRCTTAELQLLADGLARLDRSWRWRCIIADAVLASGCHRLEHVECDLDLRSRAAWRFLGSRRWMAADAVLRTAAALHEVTAVAWTERQEQLRRVWSELEAEANPVSLACHVDAELGWRTAVAQLRQLRLAVARARGVGRPRLDDPLGDGPLREPAAEREALTRR